MTRFFLLFGYFLCSLAMAQEGAGGAARPAAAASKGRYVYVPKKRCPFLLGKENELVKEIQSALNTMLTQCHDLRDRIQDLQKQFNSLEPEISHFEYRLNGAAREKGVTPLGSYRGVKGVEADCSNFPRVFRAEREDARMRAELREKTAVGEDYQACMDLPQAQRISCINDVYSMKMIETADNCRLSAEELAKVTFKDKALTTFSNFQDSLLTLLDDDTLRSNCKGDVEALKTQATRAVIEMTGSMPGIQPAGAVAAFGTAVGAKILGRIVDRVKNRFVPNPNEDFQKLQDLNENKSLFCLTLEAESKSKGCEVTSVDDDEKYDGSDFPKKLDPRYTSFYNGHGEGKSSIIDLLSSLNTVFKKVKESGNFDSVFNDASGKPAFDQLTAALRGSVKDYTQADPRTGKLLIDPKTNDVKSEAMYQYLYRVGNSMMAQARGKGDIYWINTKKMGQSLINLAKAHYEYELALKAYENDENNNEADLEKKRIALIRSFISLPTQGDDEAEKKPPTMTPVELALARAWQLNGGAKNPYLQYRQWEAKKRLWEDLRKEAQVDHDELDNHYTALASQVRPRIATQLADSNARLNNAIKALSETGGLSKDPAKRRTWYRSNVLPLFRACYLLRGIFYNKGEVRKNQKANQMLADEGSPQRATFDENCSPVRACAPPFRGMDIAKFDREQCERTFLYDQKMAEFENYFVDNGVICPPIDVGQAPAGRGNFFRRHF